MCTKSSCEEPRSEGPWYMEEDIITRYNITLFELRYEILDLTSRIFNLHKIRKITVLAIGN